MKDYYRQVLIYLCSIKLLNEQRKENPLFELSSLFWFAEIVSYLVFYLNLREQD